MFDRLWHMVAQVELDLLARVLRPDSEPMLPDVARYFLDLHIEDRDKQRMTELGEKANAGLLIGDEAAELDGLIRVTYVLGMLHSKARMSLKQKNTAA